jgi:hypothetical protein
VWESEGGVSGWATTHLRGGGLALEEVLHHEAPAAQVRARHLGFGRIVALGIEAPNMLANLV